MISGARCFSVNIIWSAFYSAGINFTEQSSVCYLQHVLQNLINELYSSHVLGYALSAMDVLLEKGWFLAICKLLLF